MTRQDQKPEDPAQVAEMVKDEESAAGLENQIGKQTEAQAGEALLKNNVSPQLIVHHLPPTKSTDQKLEDQTEARAEEFKPVISTRMFKSKKNQLNKVSLLKKNSQQE